MTLKFILLDAYRFFAGFRKLILSTSVLEPEADFLNFETEFFSLQFSEH
jgi:hypothetical protein